MLLTLKPRYPISEETEQVARAAFSKGNLYVSVVTARSDPFITTNGLLTYFIAGAS